MPAPRVVFSMHNDRNDCSLLAMVVIRAYVERQCRSAVGKSAIKDIILMASCLVINELCHL